MGMIWSGENDRMVTLQGAPSIADRGREGGGRGRIRRESVVPVSKIVRSLEVQERRLGCQSGGEPDLVVACA